ncbi:MAG: lipocalin-like domain-containing protein [Terriglobia bacterium]
MKAIQIAMIAAVVTSAVAQNHSAPGSEPAPYSDKARFIGAWHLTNITGPNGKPVSPLPRGMLIYTPDGHMSVQLMYPKADNALSNQYVRAGYEASFGSYDVDEARHMVTHHVQGSITGDLLVGKDLPRIYQFTPDGRLIIRSARPDEHWSVTWEHY